MERYTHTPSIVCASTRLVLYDFFFCLQSLVLASWNVNGLKAILSKDPKPIETFLQEYNPDVLCLQETKCGDGDIPAHAVFKGYQAHWSGGVKKGYAGTGYYVYDYVHCTSFPV